MKQELKMENMFYLMSLFLAIAKKLNLYQVLAPNAFSPVEEFVPILQKTVSSTLHEASDGDLFLLLFFFFSLYCYIFPTKLVLYEIMKSCRL